VSGAETNTVGAIALGGACKNTCEDRIDFQLSQAVLSFNEQNALKSVTFLNSSIDPTPKA
jgi:hypothetical protein